MSIDELIDQVTREIAAKTNEFQRYLLDNPSATSADPSLQSKRQDIKLLQVKLQDYQILKEDYLNSTIPDKITNDGSYEMSRDGNPVSTTSIAAPVGRSGMKISKV